MNSIQRFLDWIHQPEYTGENRCTPCTVVNVVIAAIISLAVGTISLWSGALTFLLCIAVIYVRGYLVPGTPTLTKRYLPSRILAWFDKEPLPTYEPKEVDEEFDAEVVLVEAGALELCDEEDDLCLTPVFQQSWYHQIDRFSDGGSPEDTLADILEVAPDSLSLEGGEQSYTANADGQTVGHWESRAAFIADMAAEVTLQEFSKGYSERSLAQRSALMEALRVFLDRCPECGEPVRLSQDTVESCCRSIDVIASSCTGCQSRLFEIEAPEAIAENQ